MLNGKRLPILILFFIGFQMLTISSSAETYAVVYATMDCGPCAEYVSELEDTLHEIGINDIQVIDLGSHLIPSKAREDLNELYDRLDVPLSMRSNVVVIINNKFIFQEYVPIDIIIDFIIDYKEDSQGFLLHKDRYSEQYILMDEKGEVRECVIKNSLDECLLQPKSYLSSLPILPLIIVSGLIDGINPCAFAVLLFFLAFLFTVAKTTPAKKVKKRIFKVGSIYIASIYVTYFLIGVGVLKIISLSTFPKIISQIGAVLVIILGIISIKDYFFYGRGLSLKIPFSQWRLIAKWIHKTTFPSTFIVGFLVALFEFPCTGGIYIAILGMLAVKATQMIAIIYLLIYNIAFILPLIVILTVTSSKHIVEKMREWQKEKKKNLRLLLGIFMIALGILILLG